MKSLNSKNSGMVIKPSPFASDKEIKDSDGMQSPYRKTATLFILLLMLAPFFLWSQNATQTRDVGPFSGIDIGGIFNIELSQGDDYLVELEATDELLERTETSVKNGMLNMTLKGSARNSKIIARVTTPEIKEIKISGAASLTGQNEIVTPELKLNIGGAAKLGMEVYTSVLETKASGAANVSLSGKADTHNVTMSGAAQLRALELETGTTIIDASGASNARVWANDYLDAKASGTSKVSFDQKPADVNVNLSGVAAVNEMTASNPGTMMESGDTMRIKIGHRDVMVIEDESGRKIRRSGRKSFRDTWAGLELGVNGFLTPDNSLNLGSELEYLELRYPKSVVVNLNLFQQNLPIIRNNLGLVTGLGIGWNNYRFDNQYTFTPDRDGIIPVLEEERTIRKNKITVTHLNIPLLLELQTSGNRQVQKFHIAGGVILGTRIGTHAKYVFDDNGKKRKEKNYNNYNLQPFRLDATGRIGWGKVNLFATYSLNSLFKTDRGPELYPFSVGISLLSF